MSKKAMEILNNQEAKTIVIKKELEGQTLDEYMETHFGAESSDEEMFYAGQEDTEIFVIKEE